MALNDVLVRGLAVLMMATAGGVMLYVYVRRYWPLLTLNLECAIYFLTGLFLILLLAYALTHAAWVM